MKISLLGAKKISILLFMSAIYELFKQTHNYYSVHKNSILFGTHPDSNKDIETSLNYYSNSTVYNYVYRNKNPQYKGIIDCQNTEIKSSSLTVYFVTSMGPNNQPQPHLCLSAKDINATLSGILDSIKLPYIYKLIHGNQLHLELFTSYSKNFINQIDSLPFGSTLITTSSEKEQASYGILDEILTKSSLSYSHNPYIKFVHYILTNPDESTFAINLVSGAKFFNVNPSEIIEFSKQDLKIWQGNKIEELISFFNELRIIHYANDEIEFKRFSEQLLNPNSVESKWINTIQNNHLPRYQELLMLNSILNRHIEKAQILFNFGVSIESALTNNIKPLYISAFMGNIESTKFLIEKGANIDAEQDNKATPLLGAIANMHYNIIELLLKNNANINVCDVNGNNALILSSSKGNADIVDLLIEFKININHQNKEGATALILSSILGHEEIVKKLLTAGADTEVVLSDFSDFLNLLLFLKPSSIAYSTNCNNITMLCYGDLIELLTDISYKNKEGVTAVMLAAALGYEEIVKDFLDAGANTNIINNNDTYSTLTIAINQNKLNIVKLLLSYAPNLKSPDYISYKQNYAYKSDIHNEITKFETKPINYILENNNNITKSMNALENLKPLVDIEYIYKTQACLSSLEIDQLYNNLVEICLDTINEPAYLINSNYTRNTSFVGMNEATEMSYNEV